jgi:ADP-ribose pyrophosphatase
MKQKKPWKKLSQRYVYEHDPFIKVRRDLVIQPDGKKGKYTVVERPDAVVIVAKTKQGKFYLVKQWRYPLNRNSLGFPVGGIVDGEVPKTAAIRELAEEAGIKASSWKEIGSWYPSPWIINTTAYVFLAEGLRKIEHSADATEKDIIVRQYSYNQLTKMIKEGKIKNAFTIIALWYYEASK